MKRIVLLMAACIACAASGCDKSPDHGRKAELASANGLMPGPAPTFEEIYVVDQAQVKSAPKRTVSYEPLAGSASEGTKKSAPAEEKKTEAPKTKKADAKAPAVKPTKTAAPTKAPPAQAKSPAKPPAGSTGSFWKKVGGKALTGGGAPAGGQPTAKPGPAQDAKDKSKTAKPSKDADDDDKSADDDEKDEGGDKEKDSDEEESDSDKDDKKDDKGG